MLRFAFVNYTTLGYGDITPLAEWRLLGPMAAMNGILMVGWSAPLMFEVLRNTIVHQDSVYRTTDRASTVRACRAARSVAGFGRGSPEYPCHADMTARATLSPA